MQSSPKAAAALLVFLTLGLWAGDEAPRSESHLSASDVVSRMAAMDDARAKSLQQYQSIRRYTLDNTRFHTYAEVRVRMSYQRPDIKKFEVVAELGSGVIRKSVLHRLIKTELDATQPALRAATQITAENYRFSLVGMTTLNGRQCYILQADPKFPTKYLFTGRLWVDAEDFAVARIEGSPAVLPSMLIRKTVFVHTYKKAGDFWLPESNRSESEVYIYGKTIVQVDYGDYQHIAPRTGSDL